MVPGAESKDQPSYLNVINLEKEIGNVRGISPGWGGLQCAVRHSAPQKEKPWATMTTDGGGGPPPGSESANSDGDDH